MHHDQTELLRVGMKIPRENSSSNPTILFLLNTNLKKMGLKVLPVSYFKFSKLGTKWRQQEIEMNKKDLTNGENSNEDEDASKAHKGCRIVDQDTFHLPQIPLHLKSSS